MARLVRATRRFFGWDKSHRCSAVEFSAFGLYSAGERVHRGYAALEPRDVQPGMGEINLLPAQGAHLGCAQAMAKGQQDHGRIPVAVPKLNDRAVLFRSV